MDLPGETGEPASAELCLARRAFSILIVTPVWTLREGNAPYTHWRPGVDKSIDHRVCPLGSTRSSSSSHFEARFRIESSCSSSRI